ncbi:DUF6090 family protein [Winogradskyella sp. A2]|uniref:DUF6090 family protein n=1 Tax=Winogradskyella sp. A2 TaxID=3366944 RepID=UPI00398C6AFD
MIKFFRKIRQKLLSENKFSKYLIYAIGEIVLVVIGILIALSINNWNEERKANLREQSLYQNILTDLENEDVRLNSALGQYKQHSDAYYQIYYETIGKANYDSTSNKLDTYNILRWHNVFDFVVTIKHKNNISEITNNKIIELLNEKVDSESNVLQANQNFNDFKDEIIIPFFIRHRIYDSKKAFQSEKYKFNPLLDNNFISNNRLKSQDVSAEFDQILVELKIKTSWAIETLERLMRKNNEISEALSNELNEK